ncbi:MAG: hypothetical protein IKL57_01120 [Oscillospiraceae bacterium]|nr:hypothetical protein [Oscillospiraceae bacterium]
MINALHLLWIIPLAGAVGFFAAALCAMSGEEGSFENEQTKNDDGK